MANKIKGIYKGFKYISQIFVVKEREMDIGCPTDVKHVAHIGWDGPSGSGPTWMNEFKTAPDFSTSLGTSRDSNSMGLSTWASQDLPNIPKKQKRKKSRPTSSPRASSSSLISSRAAKPKVAFKEMERTPNLQVSYGVK